nr:MAG TPA: hypothetical protein [Caudoviricetes sp.]
MTAGAETGNVVQEFSIGNTRVKICDDYCRDRPREDVELILQRIARMALEQFSAATVTTPCTD